MISHVVLMMPKADLSDVERQAFIDAFEGAVRAIPAVRGVRVGRRVVFGAGYEALAPAVNYLAVIDFDDMAGLREYLEHPAHHELGAMFYRCLSTGMAWDFEVGGIESLRRSGGFFQS
jgi:hypothetical protein